MKDFSDSACLNCTQMKDLASSCHRHISRISHEIRNPLTLIYSSMQLMEKDCPEITQTILWPQIKEDMQSALHLLKDISSLSIQRTLISGPINLRAFLSSIAASFAPLMKDRNILFTVEYDFLPDSFCFSGDEVKLREALTNLLLNAADALSSADSSAHISLYIAKTDTSLSIHVKDNGPGIPEAYRATLFDAFVTHKPGGTGLGLNIVQNTALLHGGSVSVDTCCTPGAAYTDFCLSIPL